MKPFNLEEAKAGKKVVTRDGRNVRIASFRNGSDTFPISAAVDSGIRDVINEYTINGSYYRSGDEDNLDLLMADDEQEVSDLQKWCREILSIVQAAANGEEIEHLIDDSYWCAKDNLCFYFDTKYRIKPKVKTVNGFEAPMHETVASNIKAYSEVFMPELASNGFFCAMQWRGSAHNLTMMKRGLVCKSKDDAIKVAKVMLGINPEDGKL